MHSKLQLLAYPSYLRIVVPSANLTAYDWGETGVMENVSENSTGQRENANSSQTCFIIDLPRLSHEQELDQLTDFGKDLVYFMTAMGLEQTVINSIRRFDFTRTQKYAFIHSM
jgi:hypothetical protein